MTDLRTEIYARQPDAATAILQKACIGVAGAGGLGSVVAENLARAGVGKLIIADYDVIEPSNLNRQRFTIAQLGMPKAKALAENIGSFNPFVKVEQIIDRLTFENCGLYFGDCDIIAECLDDAEEKAAIVAGALKALPRVKIVAASGLAGLGDGDAILTHRINDRLYIVGDLQSDASQGLFASRVGIAASKQAHSIIRLLTGDLK